LSKALQPSVSEPGCGTRFAEETKKKKSVSMRLTNKIDERSVCNGETACKVSGDILETTEPVVTIPCLKATIELPGHQDTISGLAVSLLQRLELLELELVLWQQRQWCQAVTTFQAAAGLQSRMSLSRSMITIDLVRTSILLLHHQLAAIAIIRQDQNHTRLLAVDEIDMAKRLLLVQLLVQPV
jgi:hypothetical protein